MLAVELPADPELISEFFGYFAILELLMIEFESAVISSFSFKVVAPVVSAVRLEAVSYTHLTLPTIYSV